MASKLETTILILFIVIFAFVCDDVQAASRRRKPTKTTVATSTTTDVPIAFKEPGTDTKIYHMTKTNDRCECGTFKSAKKSTESPLFYQTAMQNFHCDEAKCKEMCLNLPAFSANRGVEILCAHVNTAVGLRPAVHYKNCNNNWMYAGITPKEPICCEGGKLTACK